MSSQLSETLSNDDVEYFVRMFTLLYADDTVILAESADQLQKALDAAHNYCEIWGLSVNTSKTKVMVLTEERCLPKRWNKEARERMSDEDDEWCFPKGEFEINLISNLVQVTSKLLMNMST